MEGTIVSRLAEPFRFKSLELKNRIVMPPMCQYSVERKDGIPTDWHFVHYVSRAVGGTGLIIIEMTNVSPEGRITDRCLGLWSDDAIPAFRRIIDEVHRQGAKVAIQIAHAGRKAQDAPVPVAPTDEPYDETYRKPHALTTAEADAMVLKYRDAAVRALKAGVDAIELHGAHGYLIHQFHSPLINKRDDEYGRDPALFGERIVREVRAVMPADMPLIMRISAVEFAEGGYGLDHSLAIARRYKEAGVDIFHVSAGGEAHASPSRTPKVEPGYMVPYAAAFRKELGVPAIAVGLLDDPRKAEETLASGAADLVAVGRGMLRDPYWALHALRELGDNVPPPKQYERGFLK